MPGLNVESRFARGLTRRRFMGSSLAMAALAATGAAAGSVTGTQPAWALPELDHSSVVEVGGYFSQDWFLDSFLELSDDLSEATGNGKRLAIIWEQKGCPYCRETHMVNFSIPAVRDWISERFDIIQLDIWGAREVMDFDGQVMEERALARKSRVTFTPTIQFFSESGFSEVARMPGYFKPFHFLSMFEYVHEKAHTETDFQRYLQDKFSRLQARGEDAEVW